METGTAGVFAPLFVVADLQRPEIHHSFLVHKLYEADAVLEVLYTVVSVHRIGLETDGYAKPVTDVINPAVQATMADVGATDPAPSAGTGSTEAQR